MKSNLIARLIENRKNSCWELISRKYPEKKSKYAITKTLVEGSLNEHGNIKTIYVLDSGCGHKTDMPSLPNVLYLGTDMVLDDLRKNSGVEYKFISDIEKLPVKRETLDIVFSNMVLEHLKNPQQYFEDVFEALKPGGYVIFSTPCIYNIVVVINRMLPDRLSQKLGNILTNTNESDIFSTHYQVNSISRIRRILGKIGYEECDLIMYQPPPYAFVFSKIFCFLVIYYYKVINRWRMLQGLRGVIFARFQKPKA